MVSNAKLTDMAAFTIKGRSNGSGDPEDLTATQARTVLGFEISKLNADHTLTAGSGVQAAFSSGQDSFTLAANTSYKVRGQYYMNTGSTTHTTALAWALTTATLASFEYLVKTWSAAANTIAAAQVVHVTGEGSKVINATSTAVWTLIEFEGIMVTTLGGSVVPQINFSANPTGTNLMKRGSWVSFQQIDDTASGGWQ